MGIMGAESDDVCWELAAIIVKPLSAASLVSSLVILSAKIP